MNEPVSIENLRGQLTALRDEASQFYSDVGKAEKPLFPDPDLTAEPVLEEDETLEDLNYDIVELPRYDPEDVGKRLSQEGILVADSLARRLKRLMVGNPMMSITQSDLMPISAERSDAGLSQCERVIGMSQDVFRFSTAVLREEGGIATLTVPGGVAPDRYPGPTRRTGSEARAE